MKKKLFIRQISCIVMSIAIIVNNFQVVRAEDMTKELKKEIISLKTVEAKDSLRDLMPLKKILRDKTIVGMGEATHGTSEFFKMKHRMFRFLVEEMGFRAFAIEANFGEGQIINYYILNGVGNEYDVMHTFAFWTWTKDEVKEMINWMREYNLKAKDKDKIRFYGFDMQDNYLESEALKSYLGKVKPELAKKFNSIKPYEDKIKYMDEQIKDFETYKDEMIKKSSKEEYEIMLKNLDIIKQSENYKNKPRVEDFMYRDKCMAENTKWIVDREKSLGNGKVMLWAHNNHIGKIVSKSKEADKEVTMEWMGYYLDKMYGEKYYAIGFEFFKGKFRAPEIYELKESNNKTLGYMCNKLKKPIFYFDIKKALNNNKLKNWFDNNEVFINSIGAVYYEDTKIVYMRRLDINKDFDGLIFINDTTESKDIVYSSEKESTNNIRQQIQTKRSKIIVSALALVISGGAIVFIIYKNKRKQNKI